MTANLGREKLGLARRRVARECKPEDKRFEHVRVCVCLCMGVHVCVPM